jgi:hypothetical protein
MTIANKDNMLRKILILIGFLGILLPTVALAADYKGDITIAAKGDTVTITIPCGSLDCAVPNIKGKEIQILKGGTPLSEKDVPGKNINGNFVFTNKPEPPGTYDYVVMIDGKPYASESVTTTAGGTTAITNSILPSGEPADRNLGDIETLITRIGNLMLSIAGGIAIIYIIIGAYHYFFAFGSEERATAAKKTITWAIVGLVVIILSKVILTTVWNFIVDPADPNAAINFFF